jgi:hypothetical protein
MIKLSPNTQKILIILLFCVPILSGIWGKFARSNAGFGDYKAVACAASRAGDGLGLYDKDFACTDMDRPSLYVYLPVVAKTASYLWHALGPQGFFAAYVTLYVMSIALMASVMFVWPQSKWPHPPGQIMHRLPFIAFILGSALVWGNIAIIGHGLVLAMAIAVCLKPRLLTYLGFVLIVALCAVVKPVFLTYLAVVLLSNLPLSQRVGLFILGAALGLAPTLSFAYGDSLEAQQWRVLLTYFVYTDAPGNGFYGWLSWFGLKGNNLLATGLYLIYAAALMMGAFIACEGLRLTSQVRVWLGLTIGVLLIPRLMSQDYFLLAGGLVALTLATAERKAASGLDSWLQKHGLAILFYTCLMVLLGNSLDAGDHAIRLAVLVFSLYVMILGWVIWRSDKTVLNKLMFAIKSAPKYTRP